MFDTTAFAGSWPFRRLGIQAPEQVAADQRKLGFTGGLMSSLEAIFYNDPEQGDRQLARALPPGYHLAMTHNPTLHYAEDEVRANALGAKALRLFPGYHGYAPDDERAVALSRAAAKAGLVIQVVVRMDDVRTDYLLLQQIPTADKVVALAQKVPEARFIMSGALMGEVKTHAAALAAQSNLWVCTGYCAGTALAYRNLPTTLPAEKLLFSTLYPMLCMESSVTPFNKLVTDPAQHKAIGGDNARRLLGV